MSDHYSNTTTQTLPCMPIKYVGGYNTYPTLLDFLEIMRTMPKYNKKFDPQTGKITMWFMRPDNNGCEVSMRNCVGSCTIHIKYFIFDKELTTSRHEFNPHGFSTSVNTYLLTHEDLEQQRAFEQQERERK